MVSTVETGDTFRDLVERVLIAAGFRTDPEARIGFKKVDIRSAWTFNSIQGPERYLIEAKSYNGTLPKDQVVAFVAEYGALVRNGEADRAWLISKGPVSPDAKALVEAERGLACWTFSELQRRLLSLDGYMNDLIRAVEIDRLSDYYIPLETTSGKDLEGEVRRWIATSRPRPMMILGAYGKGKSTFAAHLAATLALEALKDFTKRVPILIPLGEISDEQSLDGLLGKVLASRHRVMNYHFQTFYELNVLGRFVVIYDGLDEMKHGMSFSRLQSVMDELMQLDCGDARILILGRDTTFHSQLEYNAIIGAEQTTTAGRGIPGQFRRSVEVREIRDFTTDEARQYVRSYLPIYAEELRGEKDDFQSAGRLRERVEYLISGKFDHLLSRPVHAQMLCRLAAHPSFDLRDLSVYELFDSFVHYLLDREVRKRGRDKRFDVHIRRRFNAALAWWMWQKRGSSAASLEEVPLQICRDVAGSIEHDLDDIILKRELTQGCLIEKSAHTAYFGHRSLHEFLVADHLVMTNLLLQAPPGERALETVVNAITPEIIDFLVEGILTTEHRRELAHTWLARAAELRGTAVSLQGFNLFVKLGHALAAPSLDALSSPWLLWMDLFKARGRATFEVTGADLAQLEYTVQRTRHASPSVRVAAAYAVARAMTDSPDVKAQLATLVALLIDPELIGGAIEKSRAVQGDIKVPPEQFVLWAFLQTSEIHEIDSTTYVDFHPHSFCRLAAERLNAGFVEEPFAIGAVRVPALDILNSPTVASLAPAQVDALRTFLLHSPTRWGISAL